MLGVGPAVTVGLVPLGTVTVLSQHPSPSAPLFARRLPSVPPAAAAAKPHGHPSADIPAVQLRCSAAASAHCCLPVQPSTCPCLSNLTAHLPQRLPPLTPAAAAFRYSSKLAPRRLLTKPAEPAGNSGWDNATHDLIVAVGDEFVSTLGAR